MQFAQDGPDGPTTAARTAAPAGLRDSDYDRLAAFIHAGTGLQLSHSKRLNFESRLARRAASLGFASLNAYVSDLFEAGRLQAEAGAIFDLATTNKTDFFREPAHFDALADTLVPRLLDRRSASEKPFLKLWSAASSNGAEAYTTAMVLSDLTKRYNRMRYSILGTDLSTEMIEAARRAVYSEGMVRELDSDIVRRFFLRGRARDPVHTYRIVPELRRHTWYRQLNLMDRHLPVDRDIDVIFLRNVLIYFAPETQKAVIERLMRHLRPGGYLILGHTEAAIGSSLKLPQVATGIFEKD